MHSAHSLATHHALTFRQKRDFVRKIAANIAEAHCARCTFVAASAAPLCRAIVAEYTLTGGTYTIYIYSLFPPDIIFVFLICRSNNGVEDMYTILIFYISVYAGANPARAHPTPNHAFGEDGDGARCLANYFIIYFCRFEVHICWLPFSIPSPSYRIGGWGGWAPRATEYDGLIKSHAYKRHQTLLYNFSWARISRHHPCRLHNYYCWARERARAFFFFLFPFSFSWIALQLMPFHVSPTIKWIFC